MAPNANKMEVSCPPSKRMSAMTTSSTVAEEHHKGYEANQGIHNDIDDVNIIDACSRDDSTLPSSDFIKNVDGDTTRSLQPSSFGRCVGRCFPYLQLFLSINLKIIDY